MASRFLGERSQSHNKLKARLAFSLCTSFHHNPRNLKRPWYILWDSVLHDLVDAFDNILVCPQYALWYVPEEGEEEPNSDQSDMDVDGDYHPDLEDEDGDDDDDYDYEEYIEANTRHQVQVVEGKARNRDGETEVKIEVQPSSDDLNIKGEFPKSPRSPLSSAPSLSSRASHDGAQGDRTTDTIFTDAGGTTERIPDFILLHVSARRLPRGYFRFEHLLGLQITHQCCAVIVENKKAPVRLLRHASRPRRSVVLALCRLLAP